MGRLRSREAPRRQGFDITLLDASKNVGGLSQGYRSDDEYPMEAGMKGFWYQYPNICKWAAGSHLHLSLSVSLS